MRMASFRVHPLLTTSWQSCYPFLLFIWLQSEIHGVVDDWIAGDLVDLCNVSQVTPGLPLRPLFFGRARPTKKLACFSPEWLFANHES